MKSILLAALAVLMLTGSVHAAEISCSRQAPPRWCDAALLRGKIVKGDYERVRFMIIDQLATSFILVSPGGDVDEALKIGRLFRKHLIRAEAPWRKTDGSIWILGLDTTRPCRGPNCTCASACALIWLGAVERDGTVGLHRPYIDDPMFAGLSPAEASVRYRQMLDSVVSYLNEMEVPKSIIESMTATSSGDIRWVDTIDEQIVSNGRQQHCEAAILRDIRSQGLQVIAVHAVRVDAHGMSGDPADNNGQP